MRKILFAGSIGLVAGGALSPFDAAAKCIPVNKDTGQSCIQDVQQRQKKNWSDEVFEITFRNTCNRYVAVTGITSEGKRQAGGAAPGKRGSVVCTRNLKTGKGCRGFQGYEVKCN